MPGNRAGPSRGARGEIWAQEKVSGRLSGKKLSLSSDLDIEGFTVELEFEGEVSGGVYEGEVTWTFSGGSTEDSFTAKRKPEEREEVQR